MRLIRDLETILHRTVRNNGDVGALIEEDRAAVRAAVLEEAAKLCDAYECACPQRYPGKGEQYHGTDCEQRTAGDLAERIRQMAK